MDRKLKALYLGDVAAFTLFLFGSSINHSPTVWLSIATGLPLSSYLVAKVPRKKELEDSHNQQLIELQNQLHHLTTEKQWLEQLNATQSQKLLDEHSDRERQLRERINELTSELENIRSQHLNELTELQLDSSEERSKLEENYRLELARRQAEINRLTQQYEAEINKLKTEHDNAIAAINTEFENLVTNTNQIKAIAQQQMAEAETKAQENAEIEKQLRNFKEQLQLSSEELRVRKGEAQLRYERNEFELNKKLDDVRAENLALNSICKKLQIENTELKEQINQLHLELYGEKIDDALVNQIQALFAEQELPTEFVSKNEKGGILTISLKALSSNWRQTTLNAVAEVLPGLMPVSKPEIEAKAGQIQIRFDNRSWLDKIKDASEDWLEKLYFTCAKDGKNLAILGARGKGKSQLAKNYCGLIAKYEQDFEIKYIQPKPDEETDFEVAGKLYTPDYVGFESVTGTVSGIRIPSSYEGILYLRDEYNRRNLAKQQAYADGKEMPEFPKLFFFIDELQALISKEKEYIDADIIKAENLRNGQTFCGKVIRDAISLGRSLGIIVLVLGQLANPSVYGWLRQDLVQFVTIIMSANIAEFAANYAPTKEEKNRIDKELEVWRKRASIDSSKDYYCYVRPMDQSGYLALMPVPGKYLG